MAEIKGHLALLPALQFNIVGSGEELEMALPHRIVVLAFPVVQSLDIIGIVEVFAEANRQANKLGRPDAYKIDVAGPKAGLLETSSGIPFCAPMGFGEIEGPVDTLIFASGAGARAAADDKALVDVLRQLAIHATRVASVCTGVYPLAATGLIDGRRATTHWARCDAFAAKFPLITVDADAIFVDNGKFHTSAGGTAGIDLGLSLVEDDLGLSLALAVARQLVVFLRRPGGQSQFSSHLMVDVDSERAGRFAPLLRWLPDHLDEDLSIDALADRVAMSPRNFARQFRATIGATPAQYVNRLRLDMARRLLTEGDLPSGEIAFRCGFGAAETMRLAFQRVLRTAPQHFRERFRSTPRSSEHDRVPAE